MELFIARRHYDYEGFEILGIFSTLELAEEACENDSYYIKIDNVSVNDTEAKVKYYYANAHTIVATVVDSKEFKVIKYIERDEF